jgi:hypothetical protein
MLLIGCLAKSESLANPADETSEIEAELKSAQEEARARIS